MSAADTALAALVGVLGEIEAGKFSIPEHEKSVLVDALAIFATMGEVENAN